MGCLIKLAFGLVVLLIGYGSYGLYVWGTERHPTPMTCSQYIRAGDPPRWVVLSDCEIKPHEAVRAKTTGVIDEESWFVPVRPDGAFGYEARLVVELKSAELIAEVERAKLLDDATTTSSPPQSARKVVTLEGLIEAEMFTGTKTRKAISNQVKLTRDFAVLREGDKPKLVRPVLSLLGGVGLIWGWSWLAKDRRPLRRPDPKPVYAGPPLPPEVMITQTRMIAGAPPRDIVAHEDLLLPMTAWLERDKSDALRAIYDIQHELLAHGQIVWGNIVQANKLLFTAGTDDCPAAIIYSTDAYYDAHPEELDEIAHSLFLVKGAATTPALAEFSRILDDEITRAMRLPIPLELTDGREVIYTSIMVRRLDLPQRRLAAGQFPVLILPQRTECVMIAPWEWWSPGLVALWAAAPGSNG